MSHQSNKKQQINEKETTQTPNINQEVPPIGHVKGSIEVQVSKLDQSQTEELAFGISTTNQLDNTYENTDLDIECPEGGYGWIVLLSSFIFHFVCLGWVYTFGVYQDYYITTEFPDVSPSTISFIGSLATALTITGGIITGPLADRYGYRLICAIGTLFNFSGLFLASFSTQIWQLYLTQGVLFGIGASLCYFPAVSVPSQWFKKRRGLATGIGVSGSGIGGLVWSVAARGLINAVGRRNSMLIASLINLTMLIAATIMIRTRYPSVKEEKKAIKESTPNHNNQNPSGLISRFDSKIFKDYRFCLLFISCFINNLGYLIPFFFLPTYAQLIGISPTIGALLVGILNGSSAFGRIVTGFAGDRFGKMNVMIICMLLSAISQMFIWTFAQSLVVLILFSIIYGFVAGGFIALYPVVVSQLFGIQRVASIIGAVSFGNVGALVGAPIAGVVLTACGGNYKPMIFYAGASMVVAALLVVLIRLSVDRRVCQIV